MNDDRRCARRIDAVHRGSTCTMVACSQAARGGGRGCMRPLRRYREEETRLKGEYKAAQDEKSRVWGQLQDLWGRIRAGKNEKYSRSRVWGDNRLVPLIVAQRFGTSSVHMLQGILGHGSSITRRLRAAGVVCASFKHYRQLQNRSCSPQPDKISLKTAGQTSTPASHRSGCSAVRLVRSHRLMSRRLCHSCMDGANVVRAQEVQPADPPGAGQGRGRPGRGQASVQRADGQGNRAARF